MYDVHYFFNTLTRKIEKFNSMNQKDVSFYCCGPTVYDYVHIGNLRTYIFEDFLNNLDIFILFLKFVFIHVLM